MRRHFPATRIVKERKLSLKLLVASLRSRRNALRRQPLVDLNDRLLRDIGLSRHDVLYGAAFASKGEQERE